MGKNETKILTEKEKTKRFVIAERIVNNFLIGTGVILLLAMLTMSLFYTEWR